MSSWRPRSPRSNGWPSAPAPPAPAPPRSGVVAVGSVLILTYHFPPSAAGGSFRMWGFARHLPAQGGRAVVVAPPALRWERVDADLGARVPAETVVYHVPYLQSRIA